MRATSCDFCVISEIRVGSRNQYSTYSGSSNGLSGTTPTARAVLAPAASAETIAVRPIVPTNEMSSSPPWTNVRLNVSLQARRSTSKMYDPTRSNAATPAARSVKGGGERYWRFHEALEDSAGRYSVRQRIGGPRSLPMESLAGEKCEFCARFSTRYACCSGIRHFLDCGAIPRLSSCPIHRKNSKTKAAGKRRSPYLGKGDQGAEPLAWQCL